MLRKHYERVNRLVKEVQEVDPTYDTVRSALCMIEEVGEVALALNVELGGKIRELKESSAQECIDVILCALEQLSLQGKDEDWIASYMDKKLDKWENRVSKRLLNKDK